MTERDRITGTVDSIASRTGMTSDAVAILAIVVGVLVLIFDRIIQFVLGILLIVIGVVFLIERRRARPAVAPEAPRL